MKNLLSLLTFIIGIMTLTACAGERTAVETKSVAADEVETLRMLSTHFLQRGDRVAAIDALRAIDDRSEDDEAKLAELLKEERAAQQRRRFSVDGAHLNGEAR